MKWDRTTNRRLMVWVFWLLVLMAGFAGLFTWYSYHAYEVAIREYERHIGSASHGDYLRDSVPDRDNAAVALAAAVEGVDLDAGVARSLEPDAWSPADESSARDTLIEREGAINALHRAMDLPYCVWAPKIEEALDGSQGALTAARLLRLEGLVGVREDEPETIERAFRRLGELANCLYDRPNLVGSLVAAAVERARLQVVHAAVAKASLDQDLLDVLGSRLQKTVETDRVSWALAAEGALALRLLGSADAEGVPAFLPEGRLRGIFARRVSAGLMTRWVDLKIWSQRPLEELLSEPAASATSGFASATVIADLMIPSIQEAIVALRTLEALSELASVAIAARRYGLENGSYEGALAGEPGLDTLAGGPGEELVLVDSELELQLRTHYGSYESVGGIQTTMDLTVWRLPRLERKSVRKESG